MAEQDEPTYAHPIIGFRCWNITSEGALGGIANKTAWRKDRSTVSNCAEHGHQAPVRWCSCGLYAYYAASDPAVNNYPVIGVVVGKGHAELHPTGFRIEEARIVALAHGGAIGNVQRQQVQQIAKEYGVPIIAQEDLATVAQQYGPLFNKQAIAQIHGETAPVDTATQRQQHIDNREITYEYRRGIFQLLYWMYGIVSMVLLLFSLIFLLSGSNPQPGESAKHPLKNPVTGVILRQPPASLFVHEQTFLHPDRWHVASAAAWLRSPYQQWLRVYVNKHGTENMPPVTLTAVQQLKWLVDQTINIEKSETERRLSHRILGYIAASCILLIVPLTLAWLMMVPLYRRRTLQLQHMQKQVPIYSLLKKEE